MVMQDGPQNVETLTAPIRVRTVEKVPAIVFIMVPKEVEDPLHNGMAEFPEIDVEIESFVRMKMLPKELQRQVLAHLKTLPPYHGRCPDQEAEVQRTARAKLECLDSEKT